jgi:hypothetical protein
MKYWLEAASFELKAASCKLSAPVLGLKPNLRIASPQGSTCNTLIITGRGLHCPLGFGIWALEFT